MIDNFFNEQNAHQKEAEKAFADTTIKTEQKHFTIFDLDQIAKGLDCHIDDPKLLEPKNPVAEKSKFSPVQVVNTIVSKFPQSGIDMKDVGRKDPDGGQSMLFSYFVNMPSLDICGQADESNKQKAKQRACQVFLKKLFPPDTTWNKMIHILQKDKDQLKEIVERQA